MDYDVTITNVPAQPIAVVRRIAAQAELSRVVPECCGLVWDYLRKHGIAGGRHVAAYWDMRMTVDIGAEVSGPIAGDGDVVASELPAGNIVTTSHFGLYHLLGAAHDAVHRFAKQHGLQLIRPCWEVYGHWTDDVTKLRTDVCYLIDPQSTTP